MLGGATFGLHRSGVCAQHERKLTGTHAQVSANPASRWCVAFSLCAVVSIASLSLTLQTMLLSPVAAVPSLHCTSETKHRIVALAVLSVAQRAVCVIGIRCSARLVSVDVSSRLGVASYRFSLFSLRSRWHPFSKSKSWLLSFSDPRLLVFRHDWKRSLCCANQRVTQDHWDS